MSDIQPIDPYLCDCGRGFKVTRFCTAASPCNGQLLFCDLCMTEEERGHNHGPMQITRKCEDLVKQFENLNANVEGLTNAANTFVGINECALMAIENQSRASNLQPRIPLFDCVTKVRLIKSELELIVTEMKALKTKNDILPMLKITEEYFSQYQNDSNSLSALLKYSDNKLDLSFYTIYEQVLPLLYPMEPVLALKEMLTKNQNHIKALLIEAGYKEDQLNNVEEAKVLLLKENSNFINFLRLQYQRNRITQFKAIASEKKIELERAEALKQARDQRIQKVIAKLEELKEQYVKLQGENEKLRNQVGELQAQQKPLENNEPQMEMACAQQVPVEESVTSGYQFVTDSEQIRSVNDKLDFKIPIGQIQVPIPAISDANISDGPQFEDQSVVQPIQMRVHEEVKEDFETRQKKFMDIIDQEDPEQLEKSIILDEVVPQCTHTTIDFEGQLSESDISKIIEESSVIEPSLSSHKQSQSQYTTHLVKQNSESSSPSPTSTQLANKLDTEHSEAHMPERQPSPEDQKILTKAQRKREKQKRSIANKVLKQLSETSSDQLKQSADDSSSSDLYKSMDSQQQTHKAAVNNKNNC